MIRWKRQTWWPWIAAGIGVSALAFYAGVLWLQPTPVEGVDPVFAVTVTSPATVTTFTTVTATVSLPVLAPATPSTVTVTTTSSSTKSPG
jgi:hypothetical protein